MGQAIQGILSVISLVCFIIVVVKMFQNGQTGLGIASILLLCVCGIGGLIAFVYGWMKNKEWNLMPVMAVWTGAIVLSIIMNFVFPVDYSQYQQQFQPH